MMMPMLNQHWHATPDEPRPRVALIAHDARKEEMAQWVAFNGGTLSRCTIFATATTGSLVEERLGMRIHKLLSGPLGGDAQCGALIAEGRVDVKALLRLAVLYDVPIACNRRSADLLISSPLFADVMYHESKEVAWA